MLLQIFSVYDSKIQAFTKPFFDHHVGAAVRAFEDEANKPDSALHKFPEDFTLFHVGTWDDSECEFDLLKAPVSLGKALSYIQGSHELTPEGQKQINNPQIKE